MANKNLPYRNSHSDEEHRCYDPLVHAVTVIDSPHRMAHDGFMYHTSGKVTGIANGASVEVLMVTPADLMPHFNRALFSFSRGDWDIDTFEDVVVSAEGTLITNVYNTNRNSSNTPGLMIFNTPTVTGDGTQLHKLWAVPTGTGQGNTIGLSDVKNGEEWILKPSTIYMVRLTNNSGGNATMSYEFLWYELDYEE